MRPLTAIFFDLDGTLTDSSEGVTRCFAYALEKMGHRAPALSDLKIYVGPPLIESFAKCVGKEKAAEALAHYYVRYRDEGRGLIENKVYAGIPETLKALDQKIPLYVVTSKSRPMARSVIAHFNLTQHFKEIYGPEPEEPALSKAALIARVCTKERIEPHEALMVGDTRYDMIGARENGVPAAGALWGYGPKEDLLAHGASFLLEKPEDLLKSSQISL